MWRELKKKAIAGAPGYEVGNDGVVYSHGMPLMPVCGVWVSVRGERRFVSYLVARAFVPNPMGREFVVHKDGNKRNNRAENLEWSDKEEAGEKRGPKPMDRPLVQADEKGVVRIFNNVPEASAATGLSQELIRAAAKRRGRTGGYWWFWK